MTPQPASVPPGFTTRRGLMKITTIDPFASREHDAATIAKWNLLSGDDRAAVVALSGWKNYKKKKGADLSELLWTRLTWEQLPPLAQNKIAENL
jgi:hypothetical protein